MFAVTILWLKRLVCTKHDYICAVVTYMSLALQDVDQIHPHCRQLSARLAFYKAGGGPVSSPTT